MDDQEKIDASFDEAISFVKQRSLSRIGGKFREKEGTRYRDIDNYYVLSAINSPNVISCIIANAELLKRDDDIKRLQNIIRNAENVSKKAKDRLEKIGIII